MGIGQIVTDKESVTTETLSINILSECAIFFFEKPLLPSFMTSAKNLGQNRCYVFTKAGAVSEAKQKAKALALCKGTRTSPTVDANFSNYLWHTGTKLSVRCQKASLKVKNSQLSPCFVFKIPSTWTFGNSESFQTCLAFYQNARH